MTSLVYAALWVFVFAIPWDNVIFLPGMAIVTRLTGLLAAAVALFAVIISGKARRWHWFHVLAFLFVVWVGCELFFFNNQWQTIPKKFLTFVQLLVVLLVIWEVAPSRKHQRGLLAAYVLGSYVAALGTILLYRREAAMLRRFAAGGGDPNDLAMTLALALPMAWYLGLTYRQPLLRFVSRFFLPVGLLAIGLTGSRGGMVATTAALMLVPLTLAKLSPGRRALAIVLMVVSGALVVRYVPETLMHRFSTTTSEVGGGQIGGRLKLWRAGLQAFAHRPLVGYGPSTFTRAAQPWLVTQSQVAHNSFISVLVEEGAVGLLLYSMMIVVVFFAILDLPTLERRFALVLFATMLITMLPLTWEDSKRVWLVLAILMGFARVTDRPRSGVVRPAGSVRHFSRRRAIPGPVARPLDKPERSAQTDKAT